VSLLLLPMEAALHARNCIVVGYCERASKHWTTGPARNQHTSKALAYDHGRFGHSHTSRRRDPLITPAWHETEFALTRDPRFGLAANSSVAGFGHAIVLHASDSAHRYHPSARNKRTALPLVDLRLPRTEQRCISAGRRLCHGIVHPGPCRRCQFAIAEAVAAQSGD